MLLDDLVVQAVQLLPRQDGQQLPAQVQALVDGAVLARALVQKPLLKLLAELQVLFVGGGELLLADDAGKAARVADLGVAGEQLVVQVRVVGAGVALADAVFHQTGQAGQHVDGRIDAGLVQIPVQHDLHLGDLAGQVRDGVGDVVVRHGQDGDLGDAAAAALDDARPLVEAGEVRVEIAGITLAAGDLALGGGELAQGLGIAGHVGHDHQHVHILLKGQVLRRRQRAARGEDALDDGVGGEVQKHGDPALGAALGKAAPEIVGHVVGDAHGAEDHAEFFPVFAVLCDETAATWAMASLLATG